MSDRQQTLIDRLLDEAEQALVTHRWDIVAARAHSILALQPEQPDALGLLDAAKRAGATTEQPTITSVVPSLGTAEPVDSQPSSPDALNREIRRLTNDGWTVTSQTPDTASMVLRAKGTNGCLVIVLLMLGILPGILYIMWPRKDKTLFLELRPGNTVSHSGQGWAPPSGEIARPLPVIGIVVFILMLIALAANGR